MATNFPTSLDSLTNPTATDTLDSPPHDTQHADANDAIEALQAKVGVDGSAVTTSLDYQLNTGYRYHSTLYFTSSGSFTKASYPWLRAIRVRCQGAGGGGGGTDYCGTGSAAAGAGGGGGPCGEGFITDIAGLAASVTVTVGSGGAGGSAGTSGSPSGSDGSDGGDSSFGTLVEGLGGRGGGRGVDTTYASASLGGQARGAGAVSNDVFHGGSCGGNSFYMGSNVNPSRATGTSGNGGHSLFGGGARGQRQATITVGNLAGQDGQIYGGGASGAVTCAASTASDGEVGGTGADGIVIVELYA